jgi:phenylalanyl-tRNA synthetase beta chain
MAMRVSYQWLSEYVDLEGISPQQLADALTNAGIEVEAVTPRVEGVQGVVVGQVLTCEQHPNADRLKVCTVDVGQGRPLTIVCGAPNVTAGQKVPVALVGATLPGGRIGKAKLRGVESEGMLCSAKEIGLETKWLPKEQTEGLYILPDDVQVGVDVVKLLHLDDVILDISLTPNRSDCLSMRGLAYEVAALFERPQRFLEVAGASTSALDAGDSPVTVRIETPRAPRYEAQVLQGVDGGPSPLWMQMRLLAMGVRPINRIVDVTNYVMLEWGQPLHAFDLDQVRQETIVVRQGRSAERIVTLDGEERELDEDTIVIADPDRAIGIAGVMGGENSEITPATRRVVLESAAFDAASVRRTGQRLGLRSEAQQRFEKGIDPLAVRGALRRATELLEKLAGAEPVGGVVSAVSDAEAARAAEEPMAIEFSPERANALLGTQIDAAEMERVFARLGFAVEKSERPGVWRVLVPTRRPDIRLEADLIEEIGRIHGYHNIPSTLPEGATTVGVRDASQRLRKRTREILMSAGMNEVFTYTFGHPGQLDALRIPEDSPYRRMIPLLRPLSDERVALRTHMLPGLAQVAAYNLSHEVTGGAIFEIGRVYLADELPLKTQPTERTMWAGLWFGEQPVRLWQPARAYDFWDAKGVVEAWLQALGWADAVRFVRAVDVPWLHPGRAAAVLLRGEVVGTLGELHPETAARLDIGSAIYAEFDLDKLAGFIDGPWQADRLPRHPAIRRDLAVLVEVTVAAEDLLDVARRVDAGEDEPLLEQCAVFDVYTGTGVPEGWKSVAIAFTYRADKRTLTDQEAQARESRILAAWQQQFGARLRG